jgi:voltage-gated potassium channel
MKKRFIAENFEDLAKKLRTFALLFVALVVFGTVGFMIVLHISIGNALMYTLETITLMHSEVDPATKYLQFFLAAIGAIMFWWIIWSLLDTIFNEGFFDFLHVYDLERRLLHMKNHIIIAGGGRVGEEIAARLHKSKHHYVIIEADAKKVKELRAEKHQVLHGDASDSAMLKKAHIEAARILVLTLPQAEKNLLVALLAKEHNPALELHARADTDEYVSVLKKAGVSTVIVPELAAADIIYKGVTHGSSTH